MSSRKRSLRRRSSAYLGGECGVTSPGPIPTQREAMRRNNCQDYRFHREESYPSIRAPVYRCDPSQTQAIAWLANSLEADGCGRPFDMEQDDVLLVWRQSPRKDTLGFYGVGSPSRQPESLVFNQALMASLDRASGGGPKRRPPRTTPPAPPKKTPLTETSATGEMCLPFILNRQALQTELQQMPIVQERLHPRAALDTVFCTDPPDRNDPFGVDQHKEAMVSRARALDMERPPKKVPHGLRRRHWYCPMECGGVETACTQYEWAKYKLDPRPYNKEFRQWLCEQKPLKSPEPRDYDQLYERFLKCFEQEPSPDPLCKIYEICCQQKKRADDDGQGGGTGQDGGGGGGAGGNGSGAGDDENGTGDGTNGPGGKGDKNKDKDKNKDEENDMDTGKDKDKDKSKDKNKDTGDGKDKDKDDGDEGDKGDGKRKDKGKGKGDKDKGDGGEGDKEDGKRKDKDKGDKDKGRDKEKDNDQQDKKRKDPNDPDFDKDRPRKPPRKPSKSGEGGDPSGTGQDGTGGPGAEGPGGAGDTENGSKDTSKDTTDKTNKDKNKSKLVGTDKDKRKDKDKDQDEDKDKDKGKQTGPQCPPCPPPGCECEICHFIERHRMEPDAPFIQDMMRAEKKRQLRAYYQQMRHREYIRHRCREDLRAPLHKCDPISCDNIFCRNPRLAEHCDCLGAVQDLQKLLAGGKNKIGDSKLLDRVEDLRRRLCQRMCDCILT